MAACETAYVGVFMKKILLFLSLMVFIGCEQTPPEPTPSPRIKVQFGETSDNVTIRVFFLNHIRSNHVGNQTIYSAEIGLSTRQEIDAYLKEVEFLQSKLKEAKEKCPVADDPVGENQ